MNVFDVKITVIKRTVNHDIIEEYMKEEFQSNFIPCSRFEDGQEFLVKSENRFRPPEGFCEWAWADIRHDILSLAYGRDVPHMKDKNMNIGGCTDWYRPVYFKIERILQDSS